MECPSSPPRVLFECDFCEGVFHTVRALRAHRYKVHGIESNAEVMVDVEHVACQMDTVNAYAEPDVAPEVTVDWQLPGTTENAKHRPKRKQCRRIQRPPSIKKQKNKIQKAKNRQKAIMKKRRMTLDNMPSCFQVVPPGSEAVAEVSKSVEFDILKSIYGDQGAGDPDLLQGSLVINGVSLAESCPAENSDKSAEEKDGISLIKNRESDFCPPQIDPCDLTCPSRPTNQESLECIPQCAQCVNLSNVLTVSPTTEPERSCTQGNGTISVGSSVPLVVPDDISRRDENNEESCVLDLSVSAKKDRKNDSPDLSPEQKAVKRPGSTRPESVNNKISVISSHPGNGQATGQCVTQAPSKHFPHSGSHPSAPLLKPDNKPRRTRTKARLKRNLHRGPDKKLPRLSCLLTPFSLKPTPVSDSPPHLSPVTSLPPPAAQPSDTPPRVPKVRLKRKNSTEFKAYVIPCAGTSTGNEDSSEDDKSDDDERSMPNLERQTDLPNKSLPSSAEDGMFDFRKTPPSLLKDGDICSTSDMADGIQGSSPPDALTFFEKAAPVLSKNNIHLSASDYHEGDQDFNKPVFDSSAATNTSAIKTEIEEVGFLTDGQVKLEPEAQDSNFGLQKEESNKTFVCQFCGKVYKWLIHFKVHESKHAGGKAFRCHSCDFSAVDRKDVLRHCDALNHTILKSSVHVGPTECTWLGDTDLKYVPVKVAGIFKKTSPPWQQKKQHQSKEVNKIPKQDIKCLTEVKGENIVSGKKRNTSYHQKASTELDLKERPQLIKTEPHSALDNWQTRDLLFGESKLHQSNAGFSRTLLPDAKLPDASQDLFGKVHDEMSVCNQVKADEQEVSQVKSEPLLLNHVLSCQSCVQNGSSDAQHVDCFNEVVRAEVLEQEGEIDLLSLGRKKKKKYNKLFNHRTRKRVRKVDISPGPSKVIKKAASKPDTGMLQADLRNKEPVHNDDPTVVDHLLNHGVEEASANTEHLETFPQVEASCETGTKMASEKGKSLCSGSYKPKKNGSKRKEHQRQKQKAMQPKKLLAKKQKGQLKKSIRIHKVKESSPADRKLSQKKKVLGANSVKGKKTNKNDGKKATVISTKKFSGGQKRKYCKNKIVPQSVGKGQDGQDATENKIARNSPKGNSCSEGKQSDVLGQHVVMAECDRKAKEPKDRHLSVFGRHQSAKVAVVGGHRCRKSSDNSTRSESLERRRPGLVHRRYLTLDDDADDDVGYHSSGSLDQVSHDEAHDSGGWKDSQSRQGQEGRPVSKEAKDNQQVVCQHIRQLMNNLFEDSVGTPSQQPSSGKLPRPDLSAVKAEPVDDEETKMSTCSSSSQSLFDLLLTAKESSERGPQSDSEVFSTSIKVKEEPSDKDEASRLKAKNALTNFAAKLSQFKFKVKPEPLKCQKDGGVSATTSQIKAEQPEPTKVGSQDEKATSDLKNNLASKRCDSGIYVDTSNDVTARPVITGNDKEKMFKADVEADLLPTKLERSLWDCILPDILSKPLPPDSKPELLTKFSTEGSGPDKEHYIYCPACCSQVLIRTESAGGPCSKQTDPLPPSVAAPSGTDKTGSNISADGTSACGDDWSASGGRIRSCTLPAGGVGHTLEGAVHLLSSLGMSWPEKASGLNCLINGLQKTCKLDATKRRLFSDSCSVSHGVCCGNEKLRAAFHCCRCVQNRPAPNQRIRLIKHHTQVVCCHTVTPIHRTLQGSYPWQHISGRHSHTDDCIYSGCQIG